jgi:hypothetical protein
MANGITDSNINDWLERNYQAPKLGNLAFKGNTIIPWLPHDESAGGENLVIRWKYGHSQGVAVDMPSAKTRADASGMKAAKVMFDYETFYSVATVDNTAIERALGGNLSAVNVLQDAIGDAMEVHGDHLETFAFSDGWPTLGAISSISGATFKVAAEDIEKWEVDLEIVLAAARTSGSLRSSGASAVVSKVDRETYTITVSGASLVANIAAAANGDFAFIKTTRIDSAVRQCMVGIAGYIPATAPGGSDAFGDGSLNRSVEPTRLAGTRLTIPAGTSTKQGLIDFFVRLGKYKIKPDALFCSYERWGELIKEMASDVRYVDIENKKYGLTMSGVRLFTPNGEVPVLPSPKCPDANVWGLTRNTWKVYCVNGPLIKPAARYQKYLDSATTDGVEIRFRSFAQIGCLAPWKNGVGTFATS